MKHHKTNMSVPQSVFKTKHVTMSTHLQPNDHTVSISYLTLSMHCINTHCIETCLLSLTSANVGLKVILCHCITFDSSCSIDQ